MKRCAIVTGGDSCDISAVKHYNYIIAVDHGLQYCVDSGISADIALGDFDSYSGEVTSSVRVIGYPKVKDDTDTMLAVKHALDRGYNNIDIFCALGGRMDHTIANIQTLAFANSRGAKCTIIGDNDTVYCVSDTIDIDRVEGCSLSILSLSDSCNGVTIQGAKYNLTNKQITNTFPLGVSNEFCSDRVSITVDSGTLLVILSKKSEKK